jgi:hypothetical protein
MPGAVATDAGGYLVVFHGKLGIKLKSFDKWVALGATLPEASAAHTTVWSNATSRP